MRSAPPPPVHDRNGFTLVEALVSLAILSLMATMLLGGMSAISALTARGHTGAELRRQTLSAQHILRDRLLLMSPQTRSDFSTPVVDANGDASRFTFYAPPLAEAGPQELQRYRIAVTPGGALTLYRASGLDERLDNLGRAQTGWQAITLLEGVKSFTIAYFGEDALGRGRRWQNEWAYRPQPPDLIRIRARLTAEGAVWPDLIVRPRSTLNTACAIDARTGRCGAAT